MTKGQPNGKYVAECRHRQWLLVQKFLIQSLSWMIWSCLVCTCTDRLFRMNHLTMCGVEVSKNNNTHRVFLDLLTIKALCFIFSLWAVFLNVFLFPIDIYPAYVSRVPKKQELRKRKIKALEDEQVCTRAPLRKMIYDNYFFKTQFLFAHPGLDQNLLVDTFTWSMTFFSHYLFVDSTTFFFLAAT